MARTAPCALLLQSYWENPRMRAGKSRTALLGTRTAPCDAILEDFVAFNIQVIYSQKSKCKQHNG